MQTNIGRTDRLIRVIIGLTVIVAGLLTKSWWGLIGLVPLATAALGWCGLYSILGIKTCPSNVAKTKSMA